MSNSTSMKKQSLRTLDAADLDLVNGGFRWSFWAKLEATLYNRLHHTGLQHFTRVPPLPASGSSKPIPR